MTDKELIKQEIERRINISLAQGYTYSAAQLKRIFDFIDSLPEESEREDLEEYAKKLAKGAALDKHNLIWMCKKGAEWQKQKDEELFSEDIWNYIEENYSNITEEEKLRLYDVSIKSRLAGANAIKEHMKETLQTEYEKGRFDMREELMEDAVECTWGSQATSAFMSDFLNIDIGDKVKVIILKTE